MNNIMGENEVKVYIDTARLGSVISALDHDNDKIVEIINDINQSFFDIDTTKWQSPERKKIDDEFFPYLVSKEKNIKTALNNCKKRLVNARNNYLSMEQQGNHME